MQFDVLLRHEFQGRRTANRLRRMEMLVDDPQRQPERILVVRLVLGQSLIGVGIDVQVGQLRRQGRVAGTHEQVRPVLLGGGSQLVDQERSGARLAAVAVLHQLSADFADLGVVLAAELELGLAVRSAERPVRHPGPDDAVDFLAEVASRRAAFAGDLGGRRGPLDSAQPPQDLVGAQARLFLQLENARHVGVGPLAGGEDRAEDVLRVVGRQAVAHLDGLLEREELVGIEIGHAQLREPLGQDPALVDGHVHVGATVRRRVLGAVAAVQPALRLDVGSAGPFTPGGRGEYDVGIKVVGSVTIDVLDDDEHLHQAGPDQGVDVGQVNVGRVHPEHGQQLALDRPLHHPHDHAGVLQQRGLLEPLVGATPGVGDMVAPLDVFHRLVERQAPGQSAHQPLAHRVGLSGLAVASTPWAAQVAGQQVKVDQPDRVVLAVEHLVVPDAPEGEHAAGAALASFDAGLGPCLGDLLDELHRHPTVVEQFEPLDDLLRRVLLQDAVDVLLETDGVLFEPLLGHARIGVLLQEHVGDGVVVADVAVDRLQVVAVAGVDRFEPGHGTGRPGVGDERGDVVAFLVIGHAPEEDRVGLPGVVAPEGDEVGLLDILVTGRRGVGAVAVEVAGHRRGHAHSCVGLDRVAADHRLHDLVLDPLGLHGQLARPGQAHGVAPLGLDDGRQFVGNHLLGLLVRHLHKDIGVEASFGLRDVSAERVAHILADQDLGQAVPVDRLVGVQALDALDAAVGRVFLVGNHTDDLAVLHLDQGTAPHAAVWAGRLQQLHSLGRRPLRGRLGLDEFVGEQIGRGAAHAGGGRRFHELAAVEVHRALSSCHDSKLLTDRLDPVAGNRRSVGVRAVPTCECS